MAETGKDFDQLLRVLIHAPARRIGRIKIVLIVIRRRNRRLATRRPERQMDHVRRDTAMPHERRMKLERQVRARDNGMDGQHVSTRPRAGRLARGGSTVDSYVKVDHWTRGHAWHGTAPTCRPQASDAAQSPALSGRPAPATQEAPAQPALARI